MAALRDVANALHCGTYDTKDPAIRVKRRDIDLLYCTQRLGRRGIASKDDKLAPLLEQIAYRLTRELVHDIKRARTVRSACIVAQIDLVVLWQQFLYLVINCQSTITGIEDSYRTGIL